jgi:hypothetical protein
LDQGDQREKPIDQIARRKDVFVLVGTPKRKPTGVDAKSDFEVSLSDECESCIIEERISVGKTRLLVRMSIIIRTANNKRTAKLLEGNIQVTELPPKIKY